MVPYTFSSWQMPICSMKVSPICQPMETLTSWDKSSDLPSAPTVEHSSCTRTSRGSCFLLQVVASTLTVALKCEHCIAVNNKPVLHSAYHLVLHTHKLPVLTLETEAAEAGVLPPNLHSGLLLVLQTAMAVEVQLLSVTLH